MKKCLILLAILTLSTWTAVPVRAAAAPAPLVVSELQTGGLDGAEEDGRLEFIELYNSGSVTINVAEWEVAYVSASGSPKGEATRLLASLQGSVAPGGYVLLVSPDWADSKPQADIDGRFDAASMVTVPSGWLAKGGGYVRLTDAAGQLQDLVAWGSAPIVDSWWRAPEIPAGASIARVLPDDPAYEEEGQFMPPGAATTPQGGGLQFPEAPEAACEALLISEILPNAAGIDAGKEFIEIHNPTATAIHLQGCGLRVGEGESFALPDELLPPGAYRAFYDAETGLVLPNATAVTVELEGSQQEEVRYADEMAEDQVWIWFAGLWQASAQPTPGKANVAVSPSVRDEPDDSGSVDDAGLGPCPAGKERNPETNRCRSLPAAEAAQPCGQGQERNPETNRCRSTAAQTAEQLKPCVPGQERNPETNRCRKAEPAPQLARVQDVPTTSASGNPWRWWVAAGILLLASGYALYEWRSDVARWWRNRLAKLRRHKPT